MKTIITFLSILLFFVPAAAQDCLHANLQIRGENEVYDPVEMQYRITISPTKDSVIFEHLDGNMSFSVKLIEKKSTEGDRESMQILTYTTDGTDELLLLYYLGELVAVSIEEIGGVGFYWVFSDETAEKNRGKTKF